MSLQARRIKKVTKAALRNSVNGFVEGPWADVSRKFVYATSASVESTKLLDEIETLIAKLNQQSIEFVVWDQEELSKQLKKHPELVDDFFGRPWVKKFCGETAANALSTRLDAKQVAQLRRDLSRIYTAAFGVADSGLIAFRFSETRAIRLLDRFVTPDLVSTTPQAAMHEQPPDSLSAAGDDPIDLKAIVSETAAWNEYPPDEGALFGHSPGWKRDRTDNPKILEHHAADDWIGTEPRQVIVGDAGAGKSTLLRHLVLDLLSEEPKWRAVAEHWGRYLPVWLPFHFFTQRIAGRTGAYASVGKALKGWFEQYDATHAWPLVRNALSDKRLLLVVDGLDEWVDDEVGHYAVAALETFADSQSIPLIVSTRPYGLARLMLASGWAYTRIAPLTAEQQRLLASHYFRAITQAEDSRASQSVIEKNVDDFITQVRDAPDLSAISGLPLFLVLLVGLHLSNIAKLPTGRFEIYDQAIQLLLADHPAKRRAAAGVTATRKRLPDRQLRVLLARVAFVSQLRADISAFTEDVLREDFLDALSDPVHLAMNAADAADMANQLLDIVEGELGLLVRKGPGELGFLHRILQEQLAAEHISNRLNLAELKGLFANHVGAPLWREVLLATLWRISRPSELHDLLEVIRTRIDETPAGLRARQILAEVTFGPYDLPPTDIKRSAAEIIAVIETHPYGPHRARLLDSVLTGLEGPATGEIARRCLDRWTLLVQEPSSQIVWQIAQIPSANGLSESICRLLVQALRNSHTNVVYQSAIAIAQRCSNPGLCSEMERDVFRRELLEILSDPPTSLAAAAALIALALEWRDDPLVDDILKEARGHTEKSIRIVALSDALGVLQTTFSTPPAALPGQIRPLDDDERDWLVGRLRGARYTDSHTGLLVAAISEALRDQPAFVEELVKSIGTATGAYRHSDLSWPVTLNVLGNDDRVADILCDQLRNEEYPPVFLDMMTGNESLLALAYPPESPQNGRLAAAIEDRLSTSKAMMHDRMLYALAAVDRGPQMKKALLEELMTSSMPYWAATALIEYFGNDGKAHAALYSVLMGDPARASQIASVATRVLAASDAIPRLLAILRELSGATDATGARYDILASAIIRACEEQRIDPGPDNDSIAAQALQLMPTAPRSPEFDPRYGLAAALYPSAASRKVLDELEDVEDRPLAPYFRAYRSEPERIQPFLDDAWTMLFSLPVYLRARLCQSLADRSIAPGFVLQLTRRWADEVSEPTKSVASLAYHRALVTAREAGQIDTDAWVKALARLGDEASSYGLDHHGRRRSAWVGMCVCRDWSMLKGRVESIGESLPVGVELTSLLDGPDMVLLQQLATCWEDLRSEFGDALLTRLSGIGERQPKREVWDALALVAAQNVTLQQELESAIVDDPGLLRLNGVLAWFVTRPSTNTETAADVLVSALYGNDRYQGNVARVLIAEPERIGLQRQQLSDLLENARRGLPVDWSDPALEALAVLSPEHPTVLQAWQEIQKLLTHGRSRAGDPVSPETYFAIAYAAVDNTEILKQIERNLDRLDEIGGSRYDNAFTRHVTRRLRRDPAAADIIRQAVMSATTPHARAAPLVSLLAAAVGLDEGVLREVERRISDLNGIRLVPLVGDRTVSATLSVRTIFTRIADTAWDVRSV